MGRNARKYALCGAAKQFDAKQLDQTFSKFDAWFESMEGLQSAEEGRNDINTLLGGEKRKNEQNKRYMERNYSDFVCGDVDNGINTNNRCCYPTRDR